MITLGLLLCACWGDLPEGWVAIKAANLGYVVSMPKPERKAFQDVGPDDKPVHISLYRGTVGKTSYIVSVSEFSKSYLSQPVKLIFDIARDGSLKRSGGTLVSEKDIKFNTIPGREIVVKAKEAGYVKARVYVYNLRQYSVMMAGEKESDLDTKEAQLFFDSFELKPLKRTIK
jgi:hypothetical protein